MTKLEKTSHQIQLHEENNARDIYGCEPFETRAVREHEKPEASMTEWLQRESVTASRITRYSGCNKLAFPR